MPAPVSTDPIRSDTVTIIMPSFNAERTIRRAIDSVVAQTHRDWHLICIDDASSDATPRILGDYAALLGSQITILRFPVNGGPAKARNAGLANATGTWISVLDADDAWRPDRLAGLLRVARDGNAEAVCDNLLGFDDHGARETGPLFQSLPPMLDIATVVAAEYQGRYNLGYLKPLARRSFLDTQAIRYDETLRTGEDLLFLLSCLASGGPVHCIHDAGYIYTTPVGQGSRRLSRSTNTAPRDADLAAGLLRFLDRWASSLTEQDRAAVEGRVSYLGTIAPLANFRHARLSHEWGTALRLFLQWPQVRRQVWKTIVGRGRAASGDMGLSR